MRLSVEKETQIANFSLWQLREQVPDADYKTEYLIFWSQDWNSDGETF